MLLTEFDDNRQAIINPQDLHEPIEGFPKVVICRSRIQTSAPSFLAESAAIMPEAPPPIIRTFIVSPFYFMGIFMGIDFD